MSLSKKKEDEKEKKFLGRLSYKLDYDFDKNAVSAKCYLCQVLAKFLLHSSLVFSQNYF
ncbi:unnamed protein product [Heligmosomoides polygyrus]|uniref:Nucleolar protein 10 n=1 Tax=Heligmosomoides polygyrus TaxID=6339 RepID=A0A183F475_HELPZ|nr:unnamed protein product [Heligmosomoides polygyrus]